MCVVLLYGMVVGVNDGVSDGVGDGVGLYCRRDSGP